MSRLKKQLRQEGLTHALKENPFLSDDALARLFTVSIQTVRLDRLELGIPELRERIKNVAEQRWDDLKSLQLDEVIGELIDLQLDESATSSFEIKEEHVFSRTQVARGDYIFAQANSLAVAVVNSDIALTGAARVRYVRPVRLGEKLIAKAEVCSQNNELVLVRVETTADGEPVFSGTFRVFKTADKHIQ